jgi:hypothetical protein
MFQQHKRHKHNLAPHQTVLSQLVAQLSKEAPLNPKDKITASWMHTTTTCNNTVVVINILRHKDHPSARLLLRLPHKALLPHKLVLAPGVQWIKNVLLLHLRVLLWVQVIPTVLSADV